MAFWNMFNGNFKIPDKPEDPDKQLDTLWDLVTNHIFSWMRVTGLKVNFILAFVALVLALMAILCTKI
jgi:RNAse (barnase) inhibitor barstar